MNKHVPVKHAEAELLNRFHDLKGLAQVVKNLQWGSLEEISEHLREVLVDKKCILVFAYNGTGKTRLSTAIKSLGQQLNNDMEEKPHPSSCSITLPLVSA